MPPKQASKQSNHNKHNGSCLRRKQAAKQQATTSITGRRPSAGAASNTFFGAAQLEPPALGHLLCNVRSSIYANSKTYRGQPTLNMRRFLGIVPETPHFAPPAHRPQSKDRPRASLAKPSNNNKHNGTPPSRRGSTKYFFRRHLTGANRNRTPPL